MHISTSRSHHHCRSKAGKLDRSTKYPFQQRVRESFNECKCIARTERAQRHYELFTVQTPKGSKTLEGSPQSAHDSNTQRAFNRGIGGPGAGLNSNFEAENNF